MIHTFLFKNILLLLICCICTHGSIFLVLQQVELKIHLNICSKQNKNLEGM